MKVLTVTIPSYNAEKYLNRGIPTLLDESISADIEIIIVDDGSTDHTARIADEYHSKYPDAVKVLHKENGGHGSAINSGIQEASGKYFCVIDADDWVDTANFIKLVNLMKKCNSDLILANAMKVDSDDRKLGYEKITKLPNRREVPMDNYIGSISNIEMHNYFIRSDILKKNHIRCHEHCFYVDQEYVLYSLFHIKTVMFVDMIVYHYLIGRKGQSVSIESRRKQYDQFIAVSDFLFDFYLDNYIRMTVNQRKHYERKIAWFIRGTYAVLLSYHNREMKRKMQKYDREIKEKSLSIYKANRNLCIYLLRFSRFACYGLMAQIYKMVRMK